MPTIHVLSSENGEFLAAFERHEFGNVWDFWAEDGTDSTFHSHAKGNDLFREMEDFASFELGLSAEDLYLTNEDETEILW